MARAKKDNGKIPLGTIVGCSADIKADFDRVVELGLPTCQLACIAEAVVDKLDPEKIHRAAEESGVVISSFFLLFEGQVWDRFLGRPTMGFVAPNYRMHRLTMAKVFSDKVKEIGVPSITAHVGFIPDDPQDPVYCGFIDLMKEFCEHLLGNNQMFCFETGQELPSTLLRTIHDVGTGNLCVNLDPANLILYGKAHPLDAVEIIGQYVRGMHAKDGVWPNRDEPLGIEKPLGEGDVNFSLMLPRLKSKGFKGPITIEREISGPEQTADIRKAITFLEPYL